MLDATLMIGVETLITECLVVETLPKNAAIRVQITLTLEFKMVASVGAVTLIRRQDNIAKWVTMNVATTGEVQLGGIQYTGKRGRRAHCMHMWDATLMIGIEISITECLVVETLPQTAAMLVDITLTLEFKMVASVGVITLIRRDGNIAKWVTMNVATGEVQLGEIQYTGKRETKHQFT